MSTAQASNLVILPNPTGGDRVVDPGFISNAQLQKQLTLSNDYNPATGENTFSAPDVASANQGTQAYASGTGHVDPASGQYKPGADTGAVLPTYGLYNRFPLTDYADPVSDSYVMTYQGISLPGSGSPLDFRLTYSPANAYQAQQIFGHGWTHSFSTRLILSCQTSLASYHAYELPRRGEIYFQESNGARQVFVDNESNGAPAQNVTHFTPQSPGLLASMERVDISANGAITTGSNSPEGTNGNCNGDYNRAYIVTMADNTVYTFDRLGRLTKIDHVHGSTGDWHPIKLIYSNTPDTNDINTSPISGQAIPAKYGCPNTGAITNNSGLGYLLRVEDINPGSSTPNNYLDFCYANNGLITEIHDNRRENSASSPSLQFTYTGLSNLQTITDWRGKVWTFLYGNVAYDPNISGNWRSIQDVVTGAVSPNNVAIAVQYDINLKDKECLGQFNSTDPFGPLSCLTINQRLSGTQTSSGIFSGAVEQFTPSDVFHAAYVSTGTGTAHTINCGTTTDPLSSKQCGSNNGFVNSSGAKYVVLDTWTFAGNICYAGQKDSANALHPDAAVTVHTTKSNVGLASDCSTGSDEYQTTFSYSSGQGTLTGINATGTPITAQYDLANKDYFDPYENIATNQDKQNIVLYHYTQINLPNEPSSLTPAAPVQDFLPKQVDSTISNGTTDYCRYSYVYAYPSSTSLYPTLPTQFDKYDLSKTPTANTAAGGGSSACSITSNNTQADERYSLTYYNSDGYLESITDPLGAVTLYTYTSQGQLASITQNYTGPQLNGSEADGSGTIPAYIASSAANVTTTYQYDGDGRLTDTINGVTGRDDHTLYCDSSNTVFQILNDTSVSLTNCTSLPTQTASQNVASSSQYDESGRQTRITNASGQATNFNYDTVGRISTVTHTDTSNHVVAQMAYTYATFPGSSSTAGYTQVSVTYQRLPSGSPITSGPTAMTDVVCYDVIHRVIAYVENISPSNSGWNCVQTLAAGTTPDQNALTLITYDGTTSKGAQGHLPSTITNYAANLLTTFTYDSAGNTTQVSNKDRVTGQTFSWTSYYDQFNRLVGSADPLATDSTLHNQWVCYNLDNKVVFQIQNPSSGSNIPACVSDDSGIAADSVSATKSPTVNWAPQPNAPGSPSTGTPSSDLDTNIQVWMMYDGLGRTTDTYDALGRHNKTYYDALGRVQSTIKNNTGSSFNAATPDLNNIVFITYNLGSSTQPATQTQTDWLNRISFTQFDALGHKVKTIQDNTSGSGNDQNITTLYQYDFLGRVVAQSDPGAVPAASWAADGSTIVGKQTSVLYDALGNKLSVTDPSGATTSTTYDALNQPLTVQGPDTAPISYTYDGLQRLIQTTTTATPAITTATCYTNYSASGERSVISVQNAPVGNACPATGSGGGTLQAKAFYNLFGEPTQVVQNYQSSGAKAVDTDVTTNFVYDAVGNLNKAQLPNDATANPSQVFTYDNLNRLTQSQQLISGTTKQTWTTWYDAAGRPAVGTTPQGIKSTTTYDLTDNITSIVRSGSGQSDSVTLQYLYSASSVQNALGSTIWTKQVKMTDASSPTIPTVYNYDIIDRITSITGGLLNLGSAAAPLNNPLSYQYDADGRRTQIKLPDGRTVGYAYNDNSSLKSATLNSGWTTPGIVNYTYVPSSHLPSRIVYPNNVTQTLGYDGDLRLKSLDYTNTVTSTDLMNIVYTFDNFGNRQTATEKLPEAIPTVTPETDTIGVYRSNGQFYLRNTNTAGSPDISVDYSSQTGGSAGTKYTPVVGDWTGIAADTIAAYNTATGLFKLCYVNDTTGCAQAADVDQITYGGQAGDVPLVGHWFNTMLHDGLGIARASNGLMFLFKNTLATGPADDTEIYGLPGDQALAGDWAGQGNDAPGVYRPSSAQFFLSNAVVNGTGTTNENFSFGSTSGGYTALAGNWTGLVSGFGVGLFQNSTGTFYLKNQLSSGTADNTFIFGLPGDTPVAGHWAADNGSTPQTPQVAKPPSLLIPPTKTAPNGGSVPGDNQISSIDQVIYLDKTLPQPDLSRAMLSAPPLLNRVITYSYDGLNRLTGAAYVDNGANHYQYTYGYDLNSNRLTSLGQNFLTPLHPTFDSTTNIYNSANQLNTAVTQNGTTTFQYFADGTLGSQVYQAVNSATSSYTISYGYDAADRLNNVHNNLLNQNTCYAYDGQDHRVQAQTGTGSSCQSGTIVTTRYLVDPTGSLPQVLAEYPGNTSPTYYIPAGMLIGQDQGANGGLSYFATDGLGSVRSLLNSSGTTAGLVNFDPYGSILPDLGALGINSHLGYTGALTDANGLVYLNARYYNPANGEFLSSDPLAGKPANPGSFNLYTYVRGNPINFTDKSGKDPVLNAWANGVCAATILFEALAPACLGVAVIAFISNTAESNQQPNSSHVVYLTGVSLALKPAATLTPTTPTTKTTSANFGCSNGFTFECPLSPQTNSSAGQTCSFNAGTLVDTINGELPIGNLKIGMKVLSYNQVTHQNEYNIIDAVLVHSDPVIVDLIISGEIIHTTPEHPFYTVNGGWKSVAELALGDMVRKSDGTFGVVESVKFSAQSQIMYNLTVHDAHTFYVGVGQWLVHNDCFPPIKSTGGRTYTFEKASDGTITVTITDSAGTVVGEVTGVPGNLIPQPSRYGNGVVLQQPNAPSKNTKPQIRLMDPDGDHPNGYMRVQNVDGNYADADGNFTFGGDASHHDLNPDSPIDVPFTDIAW